MRVWEIKGSQWSSCHSSKIQFLFLCWNTKTKATWGGQGLFPLTDERPSWREVKSGTWRFLKQRPQRTTCSAYSLKYPRTTWPGMTVISRIWPTDFPVGQPDGGDLSAESPSSQPTPARQNKKKQPAHHPSLKTWIQSPRNQMKSKQSQVGMCCNPSTGR